MEREQRKLVYLCGPIDLAPGGEEELSAYVWAAGFNVYVPKRAFRVHVDSVPDGQLQRINELAVLSADVVLAVWPRGVPSVGVPVEIEQALQDGLRRVVLVHDGWLDASWQVARWVERGLQVWSSLELALVFLGEVFDAKPEETKDCQNCGSPKGLPHMFGCTR